MKISSIIAVVCCGIASCEAIAPMPKDHQARFLDEREVLETELDGWKRSPAGRVAKAKGFYHEDPHESTAALDEQLRRLFLTKLSIEEAQKGNPNARFSLSSPFTLMTEDEFAQFVARSSGDMGALEHSATNITDSTPRNLRNLATSVDWTTGKCVAPVKMQGNCSSCWAFAAVGALESALCLKTGNLTVLSEQELVSCSHMGTYGCKGGFASSGLGYFKRQGSASTQDSYPYKSGDTDQDGTCSLEDRTKITFQIASNKYPAVSETALIAAINQQPVAVSIGAGNKYFKQYSGGVLSVCGNTMLDHAVIAVGYDENSFKIRNSWSAAWGEAGYIRLERQGETKAACSLINDRAVYPVLA